MKGRPAPPQLGLPSFRIETFSPLMPVLLVLSVTTALVLGTLVERYSLVVTLGAATACGLLLIATNTRLVQPTFQVALAIVIVGYIVLGKAFAYLAVPPIYIGEAVLALGILTILFSSSVKALQPTGWLIVLLAGLAILRFVPVSVSNGMIALQDLALIYYAFFAVLAYWFVTQQSLSNFIDLFHHILPYLAWWMLISVVLDSVLNLTFPSVPASDVSWLTLKNADRGIWLGIMGSFALLKVYRDGQHTGRLWTFAFWTGWLGATAWVASTTRGGLLALCAALATSFVLRPSSAWIKAILVGLVLASGLAILDPAIPVSENRTITVSQVTRNVTSIFAENPEGAGRLQGTKSFRLDFWSDVTSDVGAGPNRIHGLGFGVNLAERYGYDAEAEGGLRNAHNSTLTVFARMGLIGLCIWLLLHFSYAHSLVTTATRHRHAVPDTTYLTSSALAIWLLAIWSAVMVGTTFDPFLDGPQGAIPFWTSVGVGMIVVQHARNENAYSENNWKAHTR